MVRFGLLPKVHIASPCSLWMRRSDGKAETNLNFIGEEEFVVISARRHEYDTLVFVRTEIDGEFWEVGLTTRGLLEKFDRDEAISFLTDVVVFVEEAEHREAEKEREAVEEAEEFNQLLTIKKDDPRWGSW